jgi:hypothetical protein
MLKYFITFGGGGQNYIEAGERLLNQANEMNIFDQTKFYTDEWLKNDTEFWSQHSDFIQNNNRGYGYWIWKPYIIKKTIEQMADGDLLLYLDCGCELDIKKKDLILGQLNFNEDEYIKAMRTYNDSHWNKMDLIVKLDVSDDKYLNNSQLQAGNILFLVCEKIRNFVEEWYSIACDYHLIDDSPSIIPNFKYFKEHRHDQSIFSLLCKKYNLQSKDSVDGVNYARNNTGKSQIDTDSD